MGFIIFVSVGSAITGVRATRKAIAARAAENDPRDELVALRLARLEPAGHEIVLGTDQRAKTFGQ